MACKVLFAHIGTTAKITCKGPYALVLALMIDQVLSLCEGLSTLGALEKAHSSASTKTLV